MKQLDKVCAGKKTCPNQHGQSRYLCKQKHSCSLFKTCPQTYFFQKKTNLQTTKLNTIIWVEPRCYIWGCACICLWFIFIFLVMCSYQIKNPHLGQQQVEFLFQHNFSSLKKRESSLKLCRTIQEAKRKGGEQLKWIRLWALYCLWI